MPGGVQEAYTLNSEFMSNFDSLQPVKNDQNDKAQSMYNFDVFA